jgi:NADH dehydrogenase
MNNNSKSVIITGAGGFIGSHLLKAFSKAGYTIYALDIKNTFTDFSNVIYKEFHLNETIDETIFKDATTVIHCAYIKENADIDAKRKNIEGSLKLLALSRQNNVDFIFLTSMSALENAESEYGKTKFIIENHLDKNKDLILRPGLVIGNGGGLFESISQLIDKTRIIPLISNNKHIIQYVDINFLVNFIIMAVEKKLKGNYTLAAKNGITMKELYKTIALKNNIKLHFINIPYFLASAVFFVLELFHINLGFDSENLKGLKKMTYFEPDVITELGAVDEINTIISKL